ncbi:hypothetical protein [Amycolatopsis nigrescens]|uniref:hypothetical protein n=1 Tax=Amycolatopsis nigrescens TaxID=381445 RepID=UPI000371B22A|nr:hypothetical protein [Amycolatopsis nigrescens]
MKWFRRRKPEEDVPDPRTPWPVQEVPADPMVAAVAFWRRWYELLPEISAALGDREPQRVEHELCQAIALVHPDLQFSLERGQRAIYALVVTGQEDPALRPYTDAWKAAAPAEDPIWEYHDSVPPVPDPSEVTVNLGEHRIALADFRVAAQVDKAEAVVDVAVHHPRLAELEDAARSAMTFLPLDATLGERLAAERLRRVELAENEPAGSISLLELRELVRGLDERGDENVGDDH